MTSNENNRVYIQTISLECYLNLPYFYISHPVTLTETFICKLLTIGIVRPPTVY